MFVLFWVLANLLSKCHSSGQSTQLANVCRACTVQQQHSFKKVIVVITSSDNLGVHSLAGLQESFTVEHPGLFYFTKRSEIQENMQLGAFLLRTKQEHDKQVPEVLHDDVGNAL